MELDLRDYSSVTDDSGKVVKLRYLLLAVDLPGAARVPGTGNAR